MSAILGTAVTGAGGGAYTIDNSLRFRASASARLTRTYTATGSTQKFTGSVWVKRGTLGASQTFFGAQNTSAQTWDYFNFNSSDQIQLFIDPGTTPYNVITSSVFRDPSAWYHVVFAVDTTQATASNRVRIYVNGVEQPLGTNTIPQNYNLRFNVSGNTAGIGTQVNYALTTGPVTVLDGYLAEVYWIDGQQLTPSSFGATDASTGVWQPKAYSGSYGTNGFYLKFSDIATTSGSNAGLGKDFSGNANYWNTNNISVTSGVTYDAMTDSPTPKSSTVGNYCVLNPISKTSSTTVLNANLGMTTSNNNQAVGGTFAVNTGKWYWEATVGTSVSSEAYFGIATTAFDETRYAGGAYVLYISDGNAYTTSVFGYGASYAQGDVLACALNCDTGTVTFYKNGVSQGNITGVSMTTPWKASLQLAGFSASTAWNFNFGQRPFAYTPPSGFVALNTFNLPTPTIGASSTTLANKYFDVNLWTGNGTSQSITNSGSMQPDFVWIKNRSGTWNLPMANSILGGTNIVYSNGTSAIQTDNVVTSFNSNGFTVGVSGNANNNGNSFVGWQWRASGSNATNTAGSITSTVRANTTAGFSTVTYTGNGSHPSTVGHGLGVAPVVVFIKNTSTTQNWQGFFNISQYPVSSGYFLEGLNTTLAIQSGGSLWGSTNPTSTVLTVANNDSNTNGRNYVLYCFAPITGYSQFSSYTGNGSSNGPFVFTGFRPRWVMIKRATGLDNWIIIDTARDTYNQATKTLYANSDQAEENLYNYADILSNGFKLRSSNTGTNQNGETYIYMAFAENPFKYSLAR